MNKFVLSFIVQISYKTILSKQIVLVVQMLLVRTLASNKSVKGNDSNKCPDD